MTTFTVTPQSLMDLAAALVKVHEDMGNMKTTAKGFDGEVGGTDLEGEISDFCDGWNYGVKEINSHMGGVVQRLMQAGVAYAQHEQQVAYAAHNACPGPNSPMTPGG